jgi:hypothetical protein
MMKLMMAVVVVVGSLDGEGGFLSWWCWVNE